MKYRQLIKTLTIGLAVVLLSGCFPDNEVIYDGPLQVEFRPTDFTLRMSEATYYSANIQLIGPHQNRPLTVDFEIDTENSTAVLGEHFELDGTSATIPSNSSFASIEITAIEANIDDSRPVLVITLLDNDDVIAAHHYKTLELEFRP